MNTITGKEEEKVICRWCNTETIPDTQCSECKEMVYSTKHLMDQLKTLNQKVNGLNEQISAIRIELYNRKSRNQALYFWEQPKPSLKLVKPVVKKPKKQVFSLDDFGDDFSLDG